MPNAYTRLPRPAVSSCDIWGELDADQKGEEGSAITFQNRGPGLRRLAGYPQQPPHLGPASLETIVLGLLANLIEELLECGSAATDHLPPGCTGPLAAAPRRRGVLNEASLRLLANDTWRILDVSTIPVTVSESALLATTAGLPALQCLDVTGVPLQADSWLQVASSCPELQHLRGGRAGRSADSAVADALPSIAPRLAAIAPLDEDSWESYAESPAAFQQAGRLAHLRTLLWPNLPKRAARFLADSCPHIDVNPEPLESPRPRGSCSTLASSQGRSASSQGSAAGAQPETGRLLLWPPADQPLFDVVAACWEEDVVEDDLALQETRGEMHGAPAPSMADRFKAAYEERAQRKAVKAERNRRQAWARALRASGSVARAIALAEAGVKLHG